MQSLCVSSQPGHPQASSSISSPRGKIGAHSSRFVVPSPLRKWGALLPTNGLGRRSVNSVAPRNGRFSVRAGVYDGTQPPSYQQALPDDDDPVEAARREQASKRVERTSRYFRRLGVFGFWAQLACSLVASVILAFSIVITGRPTSPVTTYLTSSGIVAAFLSVFWSFGYIRLANRLRDAVGNPMKAPPRASVVANLKNGLIINLIGMGTTLLGLQATVGVLVAKALTSAAPIYGSAGVPMGYNPVLALDVFLVQASGNTLLSHFFGLLLTLELLRATTVSQPPPESVLPKPV